MIPDSNENLAAIQGLLSHLMRIADSWPGRAAVKKQEIEIAASFHESKPDFVPGLLPFHDHPRFTAASPEQKDRVLSCGWLAYNEKTIAIENKVITPACIHVIDGEVPGSHYRECRLATSQALVDEAYHTLMLVNACQVTRKKRRLWISPCAVSRLLK